MPRTTANQVRAVILFDSSITDLSPFIVAANELVTEICAATEPNPRCITPSPGFGQTPYSEVRLTQIETWLAAHFLAIRDPRYAAETIGKASVVFQQQIGLNMGLTPYGQQAMLLDTHGGLAWLDKHISQGKRAKVGIISLKTSFRGWYEYPFRFYGLFNGSI